jgi:hypothetical protein
MRSPRSAKPVYVLAAIAGLLFSAPAHATTLLTASLNGANERPTPVTTPAAGTGSVVLNDAETNIDVLLSWASLSSTAFLAHIHGPAGVNATATPIIDLTSSIPAAPNNTASLNGGSPLSFAVTAQQVADLKNGLWYFNVHSAEFPGGEIRGQIVPEPGTTLLVTAGLAGLAWMGRRPRVS